MPVSMTAASWPRSSRRRVRGTPMSLLKFSAVFNTRYFWARTAAIISLVVVFPTLPVICATGMRNFSR